ncbi:SIS domain-containing protein [Sphingobium amiense]|uniref:SIS domain-containing protein n=1 Tax=Sphingobium amiense TaxID=135719 RepID=A0A494VY28_9SPHN|nr:SIS domain-containing protein [Sphingobium amiense]BBD96751.1 SIS domain-containing protein [Sphingobium amiense]
MPDVQDTTADWTLREIRQQPLTLRETQKLIDGEGGRIDAFLKPLLARKELRMILAGAGTSAFIGDSLAPFLSRVLGRSVEAIATTDIVSAPHLYLRREAPTLLISFGRSGNSPESSAAIDLADRMIGETYHLIVTCNADGALARLAGPRIATLVLPEATHDRAFAMTSSFTAMMLTALRVLGGPGGAQAATAAIADAIVDLIEGEEDRAARLAAQGFERAVFLGSGVLAGVAREAALKLMELSDGAVATCFDTSLGFRHGPKTFITDRTLAVMFVSSDPLTRRYDRDLLTELLKDGKCGMVIAISTREESCETIRISALEDASDAELALAYIVPAQLLAYQWSLKLGLDPDSPNRSGTVNRVVQGVEIHRPAA